jgi:hypothetical protein
MPVGGRRGYPPQVAANKALARAAESGQERHSIIDPVEAMTAAEFRVQHSCTRILLTHGNSSF